MPLFGAAVNNALASGARGDIRSLTSFRPQDFMGPGGFGIEGGQGMEGQQQAFMRAMMGQQGMNFMGGGSFNDPNFQNAFQNNDIGGALQNSNNLFNQQFDGSQFGVGGAAMNMFGRGQANLDRAQDTSGLVQQQIDAQRQLSSGFENDLFNKFQNSEFMGTGGATSGAFQRRGNFVDERLNADSRRVLGGLQLGQQQQQFFGNLGMQQMGQGFQGMGQGFNQALQGLQQNQSAGQQRLTNAMGMFGLGDQSRQSNFMTGLGAQSAMSDRDRLFMDMFLGQQNAAANRIGATGQHAGALADVFGSISRSNDNNIGF